MPIQRAKIAHSSAHGLLYSERHHGSGRAGACPQAPRHVHRGGGGSGPAPSGLGDSRQLHRRGDERLRLEHLGDAASGRHVDHHRGRRARDSCRQACEDEEERPRGDLHDPPRRREVRSRKLQDRWRAARRRRQRRQCAFEGACGHRAPGRRAVGDDIPSGSCGPAPFEGRSGPRERHVGVLQTRFDHLPEGRVRPRSDSGAARGIELPPQGREDRVRGRGTQGARRLPAHRGAGRLPAEDSAGAIRDACARGAVHAVAGKRRKRHPARPGHAVDAVDRRARAQLRQRHSDRIRRHPRERFSRRSRQGRTELHRDAQPLAQRGHADRRRHPRGACRDSEHLRSGAAVPGADEGSAEQSRGALRSGLTGPSRSRRLAEHQQQRCRVDRCPHHPCGACTRGEPRGAAGGRAQRAHVQPPDAAGQAERLWLHRSREHGAVHRRRGLGRRVGKAGPGPQQAGDSAPAWKGAQHRERVACEGPREQGAVGPRDGSRLRTGQELRSVEASLRPHHHPG